VMDAPDVEGTKNTATITLGTDTYDWWVGYANPANEAMVFVSSATVEGRYLGGLAGADSYCQSWATSAGYSGTWTALISSSTVSAYDRTSFNWGVLKRPDGVVIANNWADLWDGSIQNPIGVDQNGNAVAASYVLTNSLSSGDVKNTSSSYTCNDWTADTQTFSGSSAVSTSSWLNSGQQVSCSSDRRLYCFGIGVGTDTKPSMPATTGQFEYAIQVPTSTLTTSNAVTVAGLGSGVAATVTITGSDGSPGFKVNGVAGTSGVTTVQNGDSLELTMTSAATASTGYSMTVTVGSGSTITWRVWTGWDGVGSGIKRVFVTSTTYSTLLGGLVGVDNKCQTRAAAAALGGTWKAIVSGQAEADYAINRVGYNWNKLRLLDGVSDVVLAGNMWKTTSQNLLNAIYLNEFGASTIATDVGTSTSPSGMIISGAGNCSDWASGSGTFQRGTSSSTNSLWTNSSSYNCNGGTTVMRLYCIEQ